MRLECDADEGGPTGADEGRKGRGGPALCLVRLLDLFRQLDVVERDRRPVAHAAEDALRHVEQVLRRVLLGDLTCVEDTDAIVSYDRPQAVYRFGGNTK